MQEINEKPRVIFQADVKNMDDWAKRSGIPLTTAEAMGTLYARAHRWLIVLKDALVKNHEWKETKPSDPRMLFCIESPSVWKSKSGCPAGPTLRLQLPINASSFFSFDRRIQWQMVFHSETFSNNRAIHPPIADMLNLLQCLLTGLVTIVLLEPSQTHLVRTSRGLPSVSWLKTNEAALLDVFGPAHYKQLWKACNTDNSVWKLEEVDRREQEPYSARAIRR